MSNPPRRPSLASNSSAIASYQAQQLAQHAASTGGGAGETTTSGGQTTPKSGRRQIHQRERSFTASEIDLTAADLLIPPQEWAARALRLHPEVLQLREQLHLMLGEDSFSRQQNVSTTEVKDSVHPDIVMSLIDNFLTEHGLTEASKTLRAESGSVLAPTNPKLVAERLQPDDLLKLVRLGITTDVFNEPDLEDSDPEIESLESYAGDYDHDVNIWQEEATGDTIVFEVSASAAKSQSSSVDSTPPIKAATLNQLIIQLTSAKSKDLDFKRSFFGTLHSFSTPATVLRKMIERYRNSRRIVSGGVAPGSQTPAMAASLPPVDPNVIISCINYWLDTYSYDFTDAVQTQLGKFIDNDLIGGGQRHLAHKMQACLTKLETAKQQQKSLREGSSTEGEDINLIPEGPVKANSNPALVSGGPSLKGGKAQAPPEPKVPKNVFSPLLTLTDIDEEEIARQLTVLDFELFHIIQIPEFFRKRWVSKSGKNAKRIVAMMNRFNNVARWVSLTLARELPVTKDKAHVRTLSRMIKIAEHLKSLGNFHSLMAFVTGWNSSLCSQLVETTKKEMPKSMLDSLDVLDRMFDPTKHFKGYKKEFSAAHPPCIPCIGIHLQELAWIEETVPERVKDKLINWQKRSQVWDLIREILVSQSVSYNLVKIHQICDLLLNLDKRIQELSGSDNADEETNGADRLDTQSWLTF